MQEKVQNKHGGAPPSDFQINELQEHALELTVIKLPTLAKLTWRNPLVSAAAGLKLERLRAFFRVFVWMSVKLV